MGGGLGREGAGGELVGRGCVTKGVVQPGRLEPARALALGRVHRRRPRRQERRHTLDMRAALRGDDGPGGQRHQVRTAVSAATPSPSTTLSMRRVVRSEERRVGKSVDLGGRRIIKKKKKEASPVERQRRKRNNGQQLAGI